MLREVEDEQVRAALARIARTEDGRILTRLLRETAEANAWLVVDSDAERPIEKGAARQLKALGELLSELAKPRG